MLQRAGVVLCLLAAPALAQTDPLEKIEAMAKTAPPDVAAFLRRALECNHWAGEEPYDKERRAEIEKAIKDLRCLALDADEAPLRRKYRGSVTIYPALDAAKELR